MQKLKKICDYFMCSKGEILFDRNHLKPFRLHMVSNVLFNFPFKTIYCHWKPVIKPVEITICMFQTSWCHSWPSKNLKPFKTIHVECALGKWSKWNFTLGGWDNNLFICSFQVQNSTQSGIILQFQNAIHNSFRHSTITILFYFLFHFMGQNKCVHK